MNAAVVAVDAHTRTDDIIRIQDQHRIIGNGRCNKVGNIVRMRVSLTGVTEQIHNDQIIGMNVLKNTRRTAFVHFQHAIVIFTTVENADTACERDRNSVFGIGTEFIIQYGITV